MQRFVNNFDWQFIAAVKGTPSSGSPATELGYGILQISQAAAAALPVLGPGQWFVMTAFKRDGSMESAVEIVKVLGVDEPGYATSGECRLRVERGREGTTPQTYISGDFLSMRWTASGASNMLQATANLSDVQDPAAALANLGASPTGAALIMSLSPASVKGLLELGSVDNVRDADKPISTAVAQALGSKSATGHTHTVAQLSDITPLGRSLATVTDKSAARAAIGAGTSSFSGAYGDLSDKPPLGSASSLNVAASGNAAAGEVVKGSDTRLTDAREPIPSPTLTGTVHLSGRATRAVASVVGGAVNLSVASSFLATVTSATTFSFTNPVGAGENQFRLLVNLTAGVITWPANVHWPNAAAPSLAVGRRHVFVFSSVDGGVTWQGAALLNYAV